MDMLSSARINQTESLPAIRLVQPSCVGQERHIISSMKSAFEKALLKVWIVF